MASNEEDIDCQINSSDDQELESDDQEPESEDDDQVRHYSTCEHYCDVCCLFYSKYCHIQNNVEFKKPLNGVFFFKCTCFQCVLVLYNLYFTRI